MKYAFFPGCAFHTSAGYQPSTQAVFERLGVELIELPDWNCCGATVFFSQNQDKAIALAAHNLSLAQTAGFNEIVTGCNACYTTLTKVALAINQKIKVRHLTEILIEHLPNRFEPMLPDYLQNMAVGAYYGCQFSQPPVNNQSPVLENMIAVLGFKPVQHSARTLCCGASHAVAYAQDCQTLIARIIRAVHSKDGQLIITVCPLCQFNLDSNQKTLYHLPQIPVLFFTQLAGLALGLRADRLGLDKLLVPLKGIKC